MIGFVKSLVLEVSDRGVLANAIDPGPSETPLPAGLSDEWRVAKQAELPLGRFGRPEEVAPTGSSWPRAPTPTSTWARPSGPTAVT